MLFGNKYPTLFEDRQNRPSVQSKVALRTQFINNGAFVNPYDISACTIFLKSSNTPPNSIVDPANGLLKKDASSLALMNFGISGTSMTPHIETAIDGDGNPFAIINQIYYNNQFFPRDYNTSYASGIYRFNAGGLGPKGDFFVVLNGNINLSGLYDLHTENGILGPNIVLENGASAVEEYIDVWTVKLTEDSPYQLFINEFKLYNDTLISVTEPVLPAISHELITKSVALSSTVNLKITTDINIGNKSIPESINNIRKDFTIYDVRAKIEKINEDTTNLPARTQVSNIDTTDGNEFTDTVFNPKILPSGGMVTTGDSKRVYATTDNTIIYPFNTNTLNIYLEKGIIFDSNPENLIDSGVRGPTGTYIITARYKFLGQTYTTEPFYFTVI
jgi:hypothetical protein